MKGFAIVNASQNRTKEVSESIDNYDGFLVSEYHFTPQFSLGLGGRYSYQSLFDNQYSFSVGSRYLLPKNLEWRASVGRSYRTPDFYELFSNIIFEGHYFLGNESLIPESSLSFDTSLKKMTLFSEDLLMKNQLSLSHNRIKDRITNALIGYEGSTPKYQNINISKYNYINLASTNALSLDENLEASIGASFTWISQIIDNNVHKTDDRYLLNMGINAGLTYTFPKWGTSVSGYYKWLYCLRGRLLRLARCLYQTAFLRQEVRTHPRSEKPLGCYRC